MKTLRFLLPLLAAVLATAARADTWTIDPVHSSVGFGVRHFFSNVPGNFSQFAGTIRFDPAKLAEAYTEATIQAGSVDTRNQKRDDHLRAEDFFLTEKFPAISFKSTKWTKTGDNTYDITGDLTIKDVTKSVTLQATHLGTGPGMKGKILSGWEAKTILDRRDFGITYGQGVVGNDVQVVINIEAGK